MPTDAQIKEDIDRLGYIILDGTLAAFEQRGGWDLWHSLIASGGRREDTLQDDFCRWSMMATSTELAQANPFQINYKEWNPYAWMNTFFPLLNYTPHNWDALVFWLLHVPPGVFKFAEVFSVGVFNEAYAWGPTQIFPLIEAVFPRPREIEPVEFIDSIPREGNELRLLNIAH